MWVCGWGRGPGLEGRRKVWDPVDQGVKPAYSIGISTVEPRAHGTFKCLFSSRIIVRIG